MVMPLPIQNGGCRMAASGFGLHSFSAPILVLGEHLWCQPLFTDEAVAWLRVALVRTDLVHLFVVLGAHHWYLPLFTIEGVADLRVALVRAGLVHLSLVRVGITGA